MCNNNGDNTDNDNENDNDDNINIENNKDDNNRGELEHRGRFRKIDLVGSPDLSPASGGQRGGVYAKG